MLCKQIDPVEHGWRRDRVASGLKQPYPLYALVGRLLPDEINHLQIHARRSLEVVLNGQSCCQSGALGRGLIGLMVHDDGYA